jgi:hypothetical protein
VLRTCSSPMGCVFWKSNPPHWERDYKIGSSVIRVGGFEGAIAAEACRRLGFRGLERPQNPA